MTNTSFRTALLLGTAVATASLGSPALAQISTQPTAADEAQSVEGTEEAGSIVVTGSRIRRPDLAGTSPVAVVDQEEFTLSGG